MKGRRRILVGRRRPDSAIYHPTGRPGLAFGGVRREGKLEQTYVRCYRAWGGAAGPLACKHLLWSRAASTPGSIRGESDPSSSRREAGDPEAVVKTSCSLHDALVGHFAKGRTQRFRGRTSHARATTWLGRASEGNNENPAPSIL